MCGRYILSQAALAERYFHVHGTPWSRSFNIAPTQQVPVVRVRNGQRIGETMRWGLIPCFAGGEPPKFSTINARIETVRTAASYKGPWQRGQRCVQVANGFYEWHVEPDGRKYPYYIHLSDQEVFGFASLWDRSKKADGTAIESTVLITMPANELMHKIHNTGNNPHRMPAILKAADIETWLTGSADEAAAVLTQYPPDLMVAYRVSPRVTLRRMTIRRWSTLRRRSQRVRERAQQGRRRTAGSILIGEFCRLRTRESASHRVSDISP